MAETKGTGAAELAALRAHRCTAEQALALFDSLPAVPFAEITTGRWRGDELDTGHALAGVLVASGWYGKQFDDADTVHPLLFAADGVVFPVDPRRVPLGLAGRIPMAGVRASKKALGYLRFAFQTHRPTARLRNVEYRGVVSAAMIYDHLPIVDHFRRVDERTLLGVMDMRGMSEPYFFILQQDVAA
ncbi:DUF4334 domain-containing protein [Nocardia sp. NPDC050175]|uniref:DUF4334 domain-containing protein n=1 Tax=Nocardia sp. NPDC050175 TaxID=3364317 RepID=UPI0037A939E4